MAEGGPPHHHHHVADPTNIRSSRTVMRAAPRHHAASDQPTTAACVGPSDDGSVHPTNLLLIVGHWWGDAANHQHARSDRHRPVPAHGPIASSVPTNQPAARRPHQPDRHHPTMAGLASSSGIKECAAWHSWWGPTVMPADHANRLMSDLTGRWFMHGDERTTTLRPTCT
jgi:hypothetical protein